MALLDCTSQNAPRHTNMAAMDNSTQHPVTFSHWTFNHASDHNHYHSLMNDSVHTHAHWEVFV